MDVKYQLCCKDKRNPDHLDYYPEPDDIPTDKECFCDNCFYGRHELAEKY